MAVLIFFVHEHQGRIQGVQTPPEIFRFFLKREGKEIERKRKKMDVGGGGVTS